MPKTIDVQHMDLCTGGKYKALFRELMILGLFEDKSVRIKVCIDDYLRSADLIIVSEGPFTGTRVAKVGEYSMVLECGDESRPTRFDEASNKRVDERVKAAVAMLGAFAFGLVSAWIIW